MKVQSHFVKTSDYRTTHASGVFGGIFTAEGMLNMTFFTDRPPLPKTLTMEIDEETKAVIKHEVSKDSKEGMIREVSMSVNMDITVARQVSEWLIGQIRSFEESKNTNQI